MIHRFVVLKPVAWFCKYINRQYLIIWNISYQSLRSWISDFHSKSGVFMFSRCFVPSSSCMSSGPKLILDVKFSFVLSLSDSIFTVSCCSLKNKLIIKYWTCQAYQAWLFTNKKFCIDFNFQIVSLTSNAKIRLFLALLDHLIFFQHCLLLLFPLHFLHLVLLPLRPLQPHCLPPQLLL